LLGAQLPGGGWPIYDGGPPEISASVKAYFALKLCGMSATEPVMEKARTMILSKGGVVRANVFTKIALALFDQYDWRGIPSMPAEIVLLPPRFIFSLYALSYWSRVVLTPLLIIFQSKPVCGIPKEQESTSCTARPASWSTSGASPRSRRIAAGSRGATSSSRWMASSDSTSGSSRR